MYHSNNEASIFPINTCIKSKFISARLKCLWNPHGANNFQNLFVGNRSSAMNYRRHWRQPVHESTDQMKIIWINELQLHSYDVGLPALTKCTLFCHTQWRIYVVARRHRPPLFGVFSTTRNYARHGAAPPRSPDSLSKIRAWPWPIT